MMFQRDFSGVFDLHRRAAQNGAQASGGHRAGGTHLTLATNLSPADAGVVFDQPANGRSRQEECLYFVFAGVRHMVQIVTDRRRNNACGPIGWRGDNLTACGVLLIDRHGINTDPVVDDMRGRVVAALFIDQLTIDVRSPSLHIQAAR